MKRFAAALLACGLLVAVGLLPEGELAGRASAADEAALPAEVKAVWDLDKAQREATPTRERISIDGLWRWQPADAGDAVPESNWGFFKVPGCWPGVTDYMQHDCQTVFAHPRWKNADLGAITAAWYQRRIAVPGEWTGRRVAMCLEYVNSFAAVYVDGHKAGEVRFPAGEVDLTSVCAPGSKHTLSLLVVAQPLKAVMLAFNDTNAARQAAGRVERRGLCGDAWLVGEPAGARVGEVKIGTSVRRGEITVSAALENLSPQARYTLRVAIADRGRTVREMVSPAFRAADLRGGRFTLTGPWKPERVWDLNTPQNMHEASVALADERGRVVDAALPVRFGFREFWIDGRDFYLNGTRIFLSALPLDNAQVSAAAAGYAGARESLRRLKRIGINFVYTHNYGCEPGSHLGFEEILRAADDAGVLVALSQPHFAQYDWQTPDADRRNGYADHARFYVRAAGNHPSVVFYSMSHNATGYDEDVNPDLIDGIHSPRNQWAENNVRRALRAEAIVRRLDPGRIVYHHSSGNLGSMHDMNFYTNMAPAQELDDWFEHWATRGVKPVFTCEYMVPCTWDWTMYRGWYQGHREFGSARVPWEFCVAEWSAQFLGDRAYRVGGPERRNLRWEAEQFRKGQLWHRWDYPNQVGSPVFDLQHEIIGRYLTENWRAYRTWGVSAISPWEHNFFWSLRPGVDKSRKELPVDWEHLQRPGFSPDYLDSQYERMDLAFQESDWMPTADGQAILRNNQPLLAYIAGKPGAFTSKDHNFYPGEKLEKQLIVINNSREEVTAECRWSSALAQPTGGTAKATIATGEQKRLPLEATIPLDATPGTYNLTAAVRFSGGEVQSDRFTLDVMRRPPAKSISRTVAVFDPKGETTKLLQAAGISVQPVAADADLAGYPMLVVGKGALTADGPGPDLRRVPDGLRVLVFEQTAEALEKRLGFRVAEYGLRQVFPRVPDHPLLAGLSTDNLRDWRGSATLLPPRLEYTTSQNFGGPAVEWCGLEVPRVWRCGNRGNVASVLIEKPARGDFLPILDGGYSLRYSPLMEYREGRGVMLLCQLDVTGRTEQDPAAETMVRNLVRYVDAWKPSPRRQAVYAGDPAGRRHLEFAGIPLKAYDGGPLSPEQVLIVGAGGGRELAANASAVAAFLKAGGHLLALGWDQQDADALLPFKVRMAKAEHVAAYFEPPAAGSLLAGVAPADVHNRDPREIPLVSAGATVLGDGVLARAKEANVVFYQFPPYAVTSAQGEVPSFVVDGQDAAEGKQSALVTLGMTAGSGVQFGQRVKLTPRAGKTYTFAVLLKGVGGPVRAHLEIERAGSPWDRAVKGKDVLVPDGRWTDVQVTFRCEKPFPEGWQAYVGSAQEGGRFRADLFRLYEGEYRPRPGGESATKKSVASSPDDAFANAGFEDGRKPWFFMYQEQLNLRRTFRRSSVALARLLANLGVSAPTPLLSRFAKPLGADQPKPGPSVVRNGDFRQAGGQNEPAGQWQFTSDFPGAAGTREQAGKIGPWAVRLTVGDRATKSQGSVMLAQHDVPVRDGQWYRITLRAKAEGMDGKAVSLALQDTTNWTSLFDYQSFTPTDQWRDFLFLVQAGGTAEKHTRFQIWHGNPGTLWLADISMVPVAPPSKEGRWLEGLYLDQPEAWDDPYRFFRW